MYLDVVEKKNYFNRETFVLKLKPQKSDVVKYFLTKNGSTKNAPIRDMKCGPLLIKNTEIL